MKRDMWDELLESNLARLLPAGIDILGAPTGRPRTFIADCSTHRAVASRSRRRPTKRPFMSATPAIITGELNAALAAYLCEHASDARRQGDDPGDWLWREYLLLAALEYLSTAAEEAFMASASAVECSARYLETCLDISPALRRQLPLVLRGAVNGLLPVSVVQEIVRIALTHIKHDVVSEQNVSRVGLESIADAIRGLAPRIPKEELN